MTLLVGKHSDSMIMRENISKYKEESDKVRAALRLNFVPLTVDVGKPGGCDNHLSGRTFCRAHKARIRRIRAGRQAGQDDLEQVNLDICQTLDRRTRLGWKDLLILLSFSFLYSVPSQTFLSMLNRPVRHCLPAGP